MKTNPTMKRPALLVLTAGLALGVWMPASALAQDPQSPKRKVSGPFEVVIGRRGNPSDTPLALAGMLTLYVDSSGGFTGELTKGKDRFGHDLPGVLFRGYNLHPDPTAADSYKVYGQITGRSVSIFFDLGNGQFIIGSGVSKSDIRASDGELSFAGGAAVGPFGGDQGDWGTILTTRPSGGTTTCTTVSILGIEVYQSCTTTTPSAN